MMTGQVYIASHSSTADRSSNNGTINHCLASRTIDTSSTNKLHAVVA